MSAFSRGQWAKFMASFRQQNGIPHIIEFKSKTFLRIEKVQELLKLLRNSVGNPDTTSKTHDLHIICDVKTYKVIDQIVKSNKINSREVTIWKGAFWKHANYPQHYDARKHMED